jgi:hypothetical protein
MTRVSNLLVLFATVLHLGHCDFGNTDGLVYCTNPVQNAGCDSTVDLPCCQDSSTMAWCDGDDLSVGSGFWQIEKCLAGEVCQSWYNSNGLVGTVCDDANGDQNKGAPNSEPPPTNQDIEEM